MTTFFGTPADGAIMRCIDNFKFHDRLTLEQTKPCVGPLMGLINDLEFTVVWQLGAMRNLIDKHGDKAKEWGCYKKGSDYIHDLMNALILKDGSLLKYHFINESDFDIWFRMYHYCMAPDAIRALTVPGHYFNRLIAHVFDDDRVWHIKPSYELHKALTPDKPPEFKVFPLMPSSAGMWGRNPDFIPPIDYYDHGEK